MLDWLRLHFTFEGLLFFPFYTGDIVMPSAAVDAAIVNLFIRAAVRQVLTFCAVLWGNGKKEGIWVLSC